MTPYKNLLVWQKSVKFCILVYKTTNTFPEQEKFGLTSQLRRASVSIPSNIAEGSKRSTDKDYKSFIRIAHGSGAEVETQLLIAKELGYLSSTTYITLIEMLDEIMKMLGAFIKKLA